MSTSAVSISVIVPHLNQAEGLETCLTSLDAQTVPLSLFEVIVVDNGSVVPPDDVIARHPGVRMLREPNPGPGLARNRGVQSAAGEVLAFIDADCRAHPDWLRAALLALKSASERSILGGDVLIWGNDASPSAIEAYERVFAYRFKLFIERDNFSGTGNLIVRRGDFNTIGPFAGISVAEDFEWGQRAHAAGFIFRFIPEMIVYHPPRRSLQELFVKWDRHIQHFLNLARGKRGWRIRWIARAAAVLISPIIDLQKIIVSDRLSGLSSRMKALAVLVIIRVYRAWRMIDLLVFRKRVVWNREKATIQ
jgi:glycosyltransferase involved in cell wall biosynthesis